MSVWNLPQNGTPPRPHPASPFAPRPLQDDPIARIDQIVRAVLATMRPLTTNIPTPSSADSESFAGSCFAERHAAALPPGTRELRIEPATVLTPLARESLKRLGVAIRIVSRGELAQAGACLEWGLSVDPAIPLACAFRRTILNGRDTWLDLPDNPAAAAGWVASQPKRAAVLVSSSAALAAWSACQIHGVRAAVAADPDALTRAVESLAPNLVVIEAAGQSIFSLQRICTTYRRLGVPGPQGAPRP